MGLARMTNDHLRDTRAFDRVSAFEHHEDLLSAGHGHRVNDTPRWNDGRRIVLQWPALLHGTDKALECTRGKDLGTLVLVM
jgi:hypothetical protein